MYNDYTLKFADEAQAAGVLFDEQTRIDGDVLETIKAPKYAAVDVIGVIYKATGVMLTTDDGEVPEMAPIPGWHANVRHDAEAPELDAYTVNVKTPVRVWA